MIQYHAGAGAGAGVAHVGRVRLGVGTEGGEQGAGHARPKPAQGRGRALISRNPDTVFLQRSVYSFFEVRLRRRALQGGGIGTREGWGLEVRVWGSGVWSRYVLELTRPSMHMHSCGPGTGAPPLPD